MATDQESLREYLNKIAREHKYVKPEITIEEISSGGANYTSKLFTAVVTEAGKEDLHLFAKVATLSESMRELLPNMYTNEQYMYTQLAKWYEKMEKENGVKEEDRLLFCKFYGFDPSPKREILVLENLLPQGYGPHNRFQSIDWPYAASAVRDLAKMHALSLAFAKRHPKEFKKALEILAVNWDVDVMKSTLQQCSASALNVVNLKNKDALARFLHMSREITWNEITSPTTPARTVIIHRDYRGNNLLHRRREDGTVDIKIVDLQTLQGGSPVTDLIYFIFTGSDEKFRAQYFNKLLDHYYSELSAAMKRLKLNPDEVFSRADFDYEMKEKLPFGLSLAVFTLPVVTVEMENAPQVDESLDISSFNVEKTSDLYAERLNGVVNDYVKWGILK